MEECIKEKRRAFKDHRKGKGSRKAYTREDKKAKHAVYLARRAAETKCFGDLSTNSNSRNNIIKIAKQIKAENSDISGDPCIIKDEMAFRDSEKLDGGTLRDPA